MSRLSESDRERVEDARAALASYDALAPQDRSALQMWHYCNDSPVPVKGLACGPRWRDPDQHGAVWGVEAVRFRRCGVPAGHRRRSERSRTAPREAGSRVLRTRAFAGARRGDLALTMVLLSALCTDRARRASRRSPNHGRTVRAHCGPSVRLARTPKRGQVLVDLVGRPSQAPPGDDHRTREARLTRERIRGRAPEPQQRPEVVNGQKLVGAWPPVGVCTRSLAPGPVAPTPDGLLAGGERFRGIRGRGPFSGPRWLVHQGRGKERGKRRDALTVTSGAPTGIRAGQMVPNCGGQGRGRTADLPIFSRTLVPTELPGRGCTNAADLTCCVAAGGPSRREETTPSPRGQSASGRAARPSPLSCGPCRGVIERVREPPRRAALR